MKFTTTGAVLLPLAAVVSAIDFNPNDDGSIKSCSQQYAHGLMSEYKYNATDLPKSKIGYFPKPHYWWESGAIWGGLIEFTQIFGDTSYVKTVQQALVANYGPKNDVIMDDKRDQQGNDDQAFWCLATMSAAEYGFPEPADAPASYLEVTENCFKNIMSRWDTGSCGGGLKWQIYPENAYGYNYKNSISNGAAFALAARLARFTGKSEYSDWATTIYDWTKKVGLIGANFEVFDGTDDKTNCAKVTDKTEWTYNNAMYLHGSAFMYDVTKGDSVWKDRTNGFLDRAAKFFKGPDDVQDVMFEICEPSPKGCNIDQQSFKAYLGRWMAKTAILAPFTKDKITNYLTKSAVAAAKSCSGGNDGKTCGSKWYKGSFDNISGLGQQLSALEVTQAISMIKKGTLPGTGSSPAPKPSSSAAPSSTPSLAAPSSSKAPATSSAVSSNAPVAPSSSSKAAESKPAETPKAAESSKPAEATKPVEATKPAEVSKPAEATKPAADTPSPTSVSPANPVLGEPKPSDCSCTGKKTVTVWVPPTAATPSPASTPCTTGTTVTTYVQASSSPVVPPVVPTSPVKPPVVPTTPIVVPSTTPTRNVTILPTSPPANASIPVLFPGAASGTQLAGSTLFVAAALAVLSALL
ncbi:hypothetical protein CC80DRAFT_218074 [Byssothecium circinans]|uniref:mannan endo-1,6-alpha-mannosidase n=1 Tax=Byssothecium circinans TaxID=147558 RepID=A0A6A5TDM7_9PLEO|nr:hypothetical protein CC80DRAFT_218074 [Byssothecium circinans]